MTHPLPCSSTQPSAMLGSDWRKYLLRRMPLLALTTCQESHFNVGLLVGDYKTKKCIEVDLLWNPHQEDAWHLLYEHGPHLRIRTILVLTVRAIMRTMRMIMTMTRILMRVMMMPHPSRHLVGARLAIM